MAFGTIAAIAAPAIIKGVGGLVGRAVAGKRKVPDLVAPAINASQAQLQDLEDSQKRNLALIEDQAARTGGNLSAAREDLFNAGARTDAAIRGNILDTVARARQQQELIETEAANAERDATLQGISSGFGAIGEGVGGLLNPVDVDADSDLSSGFQAAPVPELTFQPKITTSDTLGTLQVGLNANTTLAPEVDFRPLPGVGLNTQFSNPVNSLPSLESQFAGSFFKFNQ